MPSYLISHQAPTLLIKAKFPRKIDGIAICMGSIIPDINLYTNLFSRTFTHSFIGVLLLVTPLAVLLTIIFDKFFASLISRISMRKSFIFKPLRYFGLQNLKYLNKKKIDGRFLLIAFYSSSLGGISHLLLDLPTHSNIVLFYPWIVIYVTALIKNIIINIGTITILNFQIAIKFSLTRRLWDLFLIPISLYLIRYIDKHKLVNKLQQDLSTNE
jgi:membrane-bound metal-dependent hydrolase YbcI (DUF457 family)